MSATTRASDEEVLPGVSGAALSAYLAKQLSAPGPLAFESVKLAGQGMSDDTILIEAIDGAAQRRSLAIRRYRREGIMRELVDPERHYRTLVALGKTRIPAPRALFFDPNCELLDGACFAMERVAGHVPIPWSPEGRAFLASHSTGRISEQFVANLVELHALDWRALDFPDPVAADADPRERNVALVAIAETMFRDYRSGPEPILADALGWLRENVPQGSETVIVHGDYRTGNLVFRDDQIAAILDWEFSLLGDPMRDVAWVLASSNRIDCALASYLIDPERFVRMYEAQSGRRVDWPAVRFWQLYYQVFNAVGWMHAEHRIRTGATRDLRMLRWSYTLPVMRSLVADAMRGVV